MNDYDDLDLEFGFDDEDLDMDELGLDEGEDLDMDELGLEEDAEFGDDDSDPDDDMEDMKAVSDDPSDPEDDSGPDINGDQFGSILAAGLLFSRRARYTRQQRIYRNRYARALKRADRKRGGAGVRRRLQKTYLRMKRLWSKLSEKRRAGLKNPAATRKSVRAALGPLPGSKGAGRSAGGSVYPGAGIAAGLVSPGAAPPSYPQAQGLPPLSEFQRQEIAQQSVATNYAQRFSAPPIRQSYTMGLPPFAPAEAQRAPVPMGTPLDTLNSFTNERLQRISEGGGMGVYASPVMRVRARQILRSRGVMGMPPVISAGGRGLTGPAAIRPAIRPSTYFPGQTRQAIPGPVPFRRPAIQPRRPLLPAAQAQRPALPALRPGLAMPPLTVRPGPGQLRAGLAPTPSGMASRGVSAIPSLRPGLPQVGPRPTLPSLTRGGPPVFSVKPPAASGPSRGPGFASPAPRPNLSVSARFTPKGVQAKVSPALAARIPRFGFDNYGSDSAPSVVVPPDGYSVVPDFTTLSLSAIKEHPIKTVVSVAGLIAAGAFLVKPAVGLIRKASN